jgi:hypothetical protein
MVRMPSSGKRKPFNARKYRHELCFQLKAVAWPLFLVFQAFGGSDFVDAGAGDDVLIGWPGVDFLRVRGPYYSSPLAGEGAGEGEAAMLIGAA